MRVILTVYHILYTLHAKYEFVSKHSMFKNHQLCLKNGAKKKKNEGKKPFFSTVFIGVYFMFSKKLAIPVISKLKFT